MISIDPGKHAGWAYWNLAGELRACGLWPCPLEHNSAVIERPTIYPRSPVPPNDIVALAIKAGEIAGQFNRVEWVLPRKWKGTVPKAIMHERILKALTAEEREVYAQVADRKSGDCLDAIGLGLWYLKRL